MEKYTIETLKAINSIYDNEHGVTQSDVDTVNELVAVIEKSRKQNLPQAGDMVELTNKHGDYYAKAHIEYARNGELYVCEQPYPPFTDLTYDKTNISVNASGGAWSYIPLNLKYVGKKEKVFVVWGHGGARANGALEFFAEVSVWEYIEGNHDYTTKTHDKFHVTVRDDARSGYKYLISKRGMSHTAFHTDEEYQAWLKTFHGVEKDGVWANSKIVWTYKQESKTIPLEEYLQIEEAVIDSELCNGAVQECKRVYEGTTVKTFLPFQNNRIEMKGVKEYMRAYKGA